MVNGPSDIAPLINIVSKEKLLPEAKDEFEKKYVYNKKIKPSFLQRLKGIKPGEKQVVNKHETENLRNIFSKWVDYEPGSTEGFPSVEEHDIEVPMSKKQLAIYDSLMGTAPPWVAAKVRSNLPPNKQEASSLNKYLSGARQVGNTPRGFTTEEVDSPKIQRAYEELKKILDVDPQNKGVVYSNFLESGLSPYGDLLKKENIPYGEISGRVPQATRDQHVKDYNEGKLRALLLSPAAQQGLNLKGSTLMQLLDPAWNEPSLDQAKARAIRYKSHEHLALSDTRKFAKVTLIDGKNMHESEHLKDLGPEPLEESFDFKLFESRLKIRPHWKIKQTLMDQSLIAGIGNIYADESLWRAGIYPAQKVSDIPAPKLKELFKAIKLTLSRGIDFGGDSMSDYRNILGLKGNFQEQHKAYQRTNEKCSKKGCGGTIRRMVVVGRATHYCDRHQRLK
jgi:formamidopyrimidine-DNA glycosylase